jgi:hypothetical protein
MYLELKKNLLLSFETQTTPLVNLTFLRYPQDILISDPLFWET